MANSNERKIKIVPKYFPRAWKDAVFPEIRLAGKWLQDLGFVCGNYVIITQGENSITITALPEIKEEPVIVKQRKKLSSLPPEIESIPGDQLFRVRAADRQPVQEDCSKSSSSQSIETSEKEATDSQIIQLHSKLSQVAAPANQIIPLHPEPGEAADGSNFDTIA